MDIDTYPGDRVLVTIFSQYKPYDKANKEKIRETFKGDQVDVDYKLLKDTFDELNISVSKSLNQRTGDEIEKYIKQMPEAKEYDKFVFVFLTFKGQEIGLIHTTDNDKYDISKAFKAMTDNEDMRGKPKMIIVQADDLKDPSYSEKGDEEDKKKFKIPSDTDRLVITSTIPQQKEGSLLIRAVCDVIRRNRYSNDVDFTIDINATVRDLQHAEDVQKYLRSLKDLGKDIEIPLVASSLRACLNI